MPFTSIRSEIDALEIFFVEHRKNAIESCQFLIDWLKTKAPFWKLEDSTKGKNWVEEKQSDLDAASKWKS